MSASSPLHALDAIGSEEAEDVPEITIEQDSGIVNEPSLLDAVQRFPSSKPSLSGLQLRLAIPRGPLQHLQSGSPSSSEATPYSDSPETPSSASSPITGVVDLTKYIRTVLPHVAAHGGLSDIYLGEKSGGPVTGDGREDSHRPVAVAIKVLRILKIKDQDGVRARKRLNREVYVWHRLEHPNVVKLFGTSYHMGGRPSMIMQWYENGSAAEYLAKKNPAANRVQLVVDVAQGLNYLHTLKPPIIHGDLKGNNVLITDEGRAVLCDFGLSKVMEALGESTGYTLSSPDVGPIRWQAPEFMEDDDLELTLASDIWSFGCTAFEILTSQIPYAHRSKDALVIRDMQNGVRPCGKDESILQSLPTEVRHVLLRCWSFAASERPTSLELVSLLD